MDVPKDVVVRSLQIIWVCALLYLIVSVLFVIPIIPEQTQYTYDVKMEQAYDVDRVDANDVTEFSEFSENEQTVLYEAFKEVETGQLVGETSAEVSVTFDEQQAIFDTWRTVEMNGIIFLVAVQENVETVHDTSVWWVVWWEVMLVISGIYLVLGMLLWEIVPKYDRTMY